MRCFYETNIRSFSDLIVRNRRELIEEVANKVKLTNEEKQGMIETMPRYVNRIG